MANDVIPFDDRAIQRFGSEQRREAALRILGAQMGLTRSEVNDPAALSALVQAVQLAIDYGAAPNDMHIVSFERSVKNDKTNQWTKEKVYTLIDGVELWMKMLNRQFGHGNWTIDAKPMTADEIKQEAMAQGFTEGKQQMGKTTIDLAFSEHMAGYWCRVLTRLDVELGVNIEWIPGFWFGWTKIGNRWFEDRLPTSASPKEVALRRARKKAAKAKGTGLIPLDERRPDEREEALFAAAERQGARMLIEEQVPDTNDRFDTEDNGDILFAKPDPKPSADEDIEVGQWTEAASNGTQTAQAASDGDAQPMKANTRKKLHAVGARVYGDGWDAERHRVIKAAGLESSNDLTEEQAGKWIAKMNSIASGPSQYDHEHMGHEDVRA